MRINKNPEFTFPMTQDILHIIMGKAEKGKIVLVELRNESKMEGLDVALKRAIRDRKNRGRFYMDSWNQI